MLSSLTTSHGTDRFLRSVSKFNRMLRFVRVTPGLLIKNVSVMRSISRKSQTIGDFTVSRLSQILPTNQNSKSSISPIVWDGRGQIWRIGSVSIFPTSPRFLRWSAIIPDKRKLKFVLPGQGRRR